MSEIKTQIHKILNDNLKDYIKAGEITFVANKICSSLSENESTFDTAIINSAIDYINNDDTFFYQYKNEQPIVRNIIKLTMAEIIKLLSSQEEQSQEKQLTITVTLDKHNLTLNAGENYRFNPIVTIDSDNEEDKALTWTVSIEDEHITCEDGYLNVQSDVQPCEFTVTVRTVYDPSVYDTCVITVQ